MIKEYIICKPTSSIITDLIIGTIHNLNTTIAVIAILY
jgi:hypothetical protein